MLLNYGSPACRVHWQIEPLWTSEDPCSQILPVGHIVGQHTDYISSSSSTCLCFTIEPYSKKVHSYL